MREKKKKTNGTNNTPMVINVLVGFFNAKGAGDGWNKADRHILQPIEAHQNAFR